MERIVQDFTLAPLLYINDEGVECVERWLPVKGFEDYYEVSDLGRFKALDRVITRHNGVKESKPSRILKNLYYSNGYCQLMFYVDKVRSTFIAHRVVAEHFIPNPHNLPIVNHKDLSRDNNKVSNLEWMNHSQNALHAVKGGKKLGGALHGTNNKNAKVNDDIVREIRASKVKGVHNKELFNKYCHLISKSTFSNIANGQGWSHVK